MATQPAPRVRPISIRRTTVWVAAGLAALLPLAAATPAQAIPTSTLPCASTLFVGARGSGQDGDSSVHRGMGAQVDAAYQMFAAATPGRSMAAVAVNFPAQDVTLLATSPSMYFAGLNAGVADTWDTLTWRATRCPDERIVLAGYSQGAMVMHRVAQRIQNGQYAQLRNRLAGVLLIADGDRLSKDGVEKYGTAWTGRPTQGIGQYYRGISGSSTTKLGSALTGRVHSVCNALDPVCASTNRASDLLWISVHLKYVATPAVRAAVAAIAATALRWTMPAASGQAVAGVVGTAVSHQLEVTGSNRSRTIWALSDSASLPPGLTLSSAGLISGTPTASGTWTTTYRVRSARAAGIYDTWLTGTVSWTIAPNVTSLALTAIDRYVATNGDVTFTMHVLAPVGLAPSTDAGFYSFINFRCYLPDFPGVLNGTGFTLFFAGDLVAGTPTDGQYAVTLPLRSDGLYGNCEVYNAEVMGADHTSREYGTGDPQAPSTLGIPADFVIPF
jgi:hypothetical protein